MALKDDIMDLLGIKQEENEPLRYFAKSYHLATLDFGSFNHLEDLRQLKK